MNKEQFRQYVKSLILEVKKEKKEDDSKKEPKSKNYLDSTESKYRSDVDRDSKVDTSANLANKIDRIVKKIDKMASCVVDDYNDITATLPGVFKIRIKPVGAGLFNVEAFKNMTDMVHAIALSKEQVIDFVKVNFVTRTPGYVQSAFDKTRKNMEDQTKKAKELPKGEPVKHVEVPEKEKEDAVTEKNDQPTALMSVVKEKDVERQEDHDVEKAKNMAKSVKMAHKEVDGTLVIGKKDFGDTSKMGKKV